MSDAAAAVMALLAERAADATICPSEAARVLAARRGHEDWRAHMDEVHGAVDALVVEGRVRLSWKAQPIATRDGPYRVGRSD